MEKQLEKDGWLSLKELAALTSPDNIEKEYNAIWTRLRRGKYAQVKKINSKNHIHINDSLIPTKVKIKYWGEELSNEKIQSLQVSEKTEIITKDKTPINDELTGDKLKVALARTDLVKLYIKTAEDSKKSVVKAKKQFVETYNLNALPNLYQILGEVSYRTLERWKKTFLESDKDYRSLAPGYTSPSGFSIPKEQSEILIKLALNPNNPLISEVIRKAKDIFVMKNYENIKSTATYRRYIEDWKIKNYAYWVFYREGEKGLNDKCLPYIERDYDMIEVGDILVADGHVLNFEVINPFTGKPKRMMMILFLDMKSSYPLGWEISPTENVMSIAVALRRAIMRLGKYPKVIYLDNGRAFGARFFKGVDFRTVGFNGIFERIGAKLITAWPYHGQSKTIERFFRSFSELERMLPTYVGTSIEMQPPRMNRGERVHRSLHERLHQNTTFDLATAHRAVAWWFDEYAKREQQDGHLKGLTPSQVFLDGKGDGINKKELTFLMMSEEVKTIYRNGIKFLGKYYWNEELFGLESINAVIKYDLIENDTIYVYDEDGKFICEATRTDKVNPAAGILGTAEDVIKLNAALEMKGQLKKTVISEAKQFLKTEVLPESQRHLAQANIIKLDQADVYKREVSKEESKASKKRISFLNKMDDIEVKEKSENIFFRNVKEA
jgi:putative transposase